LPGDVGFINTLTEQECSPVITAPRNLSLDDVGVETEQETDSEVCEQFFLYHSRIFVSLVTHPKLTPSSHLGFENMETSQKS